LLNAHHKVQLMTHIAIIGVKKGNLWWILLTKSPSP